MLTVEYEKEKGMRELYEKPAGYEISVSKTFNASVIKLFGSFADSRKRQKWLKEDFDITAKTVNKSLRAKWKDGKTRISVNFYISGENKSRAVVQHLKLSNREQADSIKTFWKKKLDLLDAII